MTESSRAVRHADLGIASAALMTAVGGYTDAFLFLRHQVFGFAQTGNVIFFATALAQGGDWTKFAWPLLAYLAGLVAAQLLRTRAPTLPANVATATLGLQLAVFAGLAMLPRDAPTVLFVVPLSFVGGVRLELFRSAGGISFVSIATTGNLMRFVQATADFARGPSRAGLRALTYTAIVVLSFASGALCGASVSRSFGPALWGAVIVEAVSLAVFVIQTRPPPRPTAAQSDDRATGRRPGPPGPEGTPPARPG